jgi:hypothetical protein
MGARKGTDVIVTIRVTENTDAQPLDGDRFVVSSDLPAVEVESSEEDKAFNFVKGACLHAIGDYDKVPDTITFVKKKA